MLVCMCVCVYHKLMSCRPYPPHFGMCPLVSVITKDSYEFHSLKSKASTGRLFASLIPRGRLVAWPLLSESVREGGSQ